ncbi:MAG: DoxX family protein [Ferruginibacter sp.]
MQNILDELNIRSKQNRWMRYFTVFCRLALAAGFIPSGSVKIMGERFTALSDTQPMGQYLTALYHTGYYYTFIGIAQVTAAILLLIPRTALLGALLYFPIILNICILSFAVRFDGSLLTSPLMVLANFYLLCWDYDKLKYIFLPKTTIPSPTLPVIPNDKNKFPWRFFSAVIFTMVLVAAAVFSYSIKPYNSTKDCLIQFKATKRTQAGAQFCDCIHTQGKSLNTCMEEYSKAPNDSIPHP